MVVDQPVRALGAHTVSVRLHDDVLATVSLNVVSA
ncbi:50S ribosomal L9 C-terminal domain-containing protein [Klebsiella pneumoniae]